MIRFTLTALLLPAALLLVGCDAGPGEQAPAAATQPAATQSAATQRAAVPATRAAPEDAAEAFSPLVGTWAADLGECENSSSTITISETRFEGAENHCDITSLTPQDSGYQAALSCTGEGQAVAETIELVPVFAPTGEGINITYPDRDGSKVTVLRCE